jgi:hypothetical protein
LRSSLSLASLGAFFCHLWRPGPPNFFWKMRQMFLRGLMQTVTRQVPPCFPRPLNSPTLRDSCKNAAKIFPWCVECLFLRSPGKAPYGARSLEASLGNA